MMEREREEDLETHSRIYDPTGRESADDSGVIARPLKADLPSFTSIICAAGFFGRGRGGDRNFPIGGGAEIIYWQRSCLDVTVRPSLLE